MHQSEHGCSDDKPAREKSRQGNRKELRRLDRTIEKGTIEHLLDRRHDEGHADDPDENARVHRAMREIMELCVAEGGTAVCCDTACGGLGDFSESPPFDYSVDHGEWCFCDAACRTWGDCCNSVGSAPASNRFACEGSTCKLCNP